jgi:hypothetical protein
MRPSDLPSIDKCKHGERAKYVVGCRCELCTEANRKYSLHRNRRNVYHIERNGYVPASGARAYINYLSKMGVGKRAVADAAKVPLSTIGYIKAGTKTTIRAQTELRIMSVTPEAVSDGSLVPATKTWRLIREMVKAGGLTQKEIALRLGYKAPAIQIKKDKVQASTELKVIKLHKEVMQEVALEKSLPELCPDCAMEHTKEQRMKIVSRMLPAAMADIKSAWSCIYSGLKGDRKLYRDLNDLGATPINNVWEIIA